MQEENRTDILFKELQDFFNDDNKITKHLIIGKNDLDKIEERLYEQDIEAEIIEKKNLKGGKVRITLKKCNKELGIK